MNNMTLYDAMLPAFRGVFKADPFEILDRVFDDEYFPAVSARAPVVDVREKDGLYVIEAELPGVSEKDLKVELKDGLLSLSTRKRKRRATRTKSGSGFAARGAKASSPVALSSPRTPTARRSRRVSRTASSPSSYRKAGG